MISLAIPAMTAIAGIGGHGLDAAIGAEAMALVPMDERARLRQERQFRRRQQTLVSDAAEINAALDRLRRLRCEEIPLAQDQTGEAHAEITGK